MFGPGAAGLECPEARNAGRPPIFTEVSRCGHHDWDALRSATAIPGMILSLSAKLCARKCAAGWQHRATIASNSPSSRNPLNCLAVIPGHPVRDEGPVPGTRVSDCSSRLVRRRYKPGPAQASGSHWHRKHVFPLLTGLSRPRVIRKVPFLRAYQP